MESTLKNSNFKHFLINFNLNDTEAVGLGPFKFRFLDTTPQGKVRQSGVVNS